MSSTTLSLVTLPPFQKLTYTCELVCSLFCAIAESGIPVRMPVLPFWICPSHLHSTPTSPDAKFLALLIRWHTPPPLAQESIFKNIWKDFLSQDFVKLKNDLRRVTKPKLWNESYRYYSIHYLLHKDIFLKFMHL